jgi:apolipoprotein N-acyltransferase
METIGMTTEHETRTRDDDFRRRRLFLIAAVVSGALPALLLGLLLSLWLRRVTPGDPDRHIFVVFLAIVGLGVVYFFREAYPMILPELRHIRQTRNWDALWPFLKAVWILTLPAAPWLALAYNALRPRSMEERLHEQDTLAEAKER